MTTQLKPGKKTTSGAIATADKVDNEYTFSHEDTGLGPNVVPSFMVLSDRDMNIAALTILLAADAGIYQMAVATVLSAERKMNAKKLLRASEESDAAGAEPTPEATADANDLLKKMGLL